MIRLLDGFKICYMDCERIVSIKPWVSETNVFEPGYNAGIGEPHYPMPCTIFRGYQDTVSPVNQYWTPFAIETGIY